jgi:hypothetical protein
VRLAGRQPRGHERVRDRDARAAQGPPQRGILAPEPAQGPEERMRDRQ